MTEQKPKVLTNSDTVDLEVSVRSNKDVDDLEMDLQVCMTSPAMKAFQAMEDRKYYQILDNLLLESFSDLVKLDRIKSQFGERVLSKCLRLEAVSEFSLDYWLQFTEPKLDVFLEIYEQPYAGVVSNDAQCDLSPVPSPTMPTPPHSP